MKTPLSALVFLTLPALVVVLTAAGLLAALVALCLGLTDGLRAGIRTTDPYRKLRNHPEA